MNIIGIGVDIVDVEQIKDILNRNEKSFLTSVLSTKEYNYCTQFKDKEIRIAGRFAAKEAVVKALGEGFTEKISLLDIEILQSKKGAPLVFLSEKSKSWFNNPKILLSISHNKKYAVSSAIALV